MANIAAYSRHKFLEEITEPLDSQEGVLSPSEQRRRFLVNLSGEADAAVADLVAVLSTTDGAGTANTGVTAAEYGSGIAHTTVLTLADLTFGVTDDGAALASGYLVYTLPAGVCRIKSASYSIGVTVAGGGTPTTDTPDMGVGTALAAGANALLSSAGATTENIITGQTVNDLAGTVEQVSVAVNLMIATGGAHTIYLNIADTWADMTPDDSALVANGVIVIEWDRLTTS